MRATIFFRSFGLSNHCGCIQPLTFINKYLITQQFIKTISKCSYRVQPFAALTKGIGVTYQQSSTPCLDDLLNLIVLHLLCLLLKLPRLLAQCLDGVVGLSDFSFPHQELSLRSHHPRMQTKLIKTGNILKKLDNSHWKQVLLLTSSASGFPCMYVCYLLP